MAGGVPGGPRARSTQEDARPAQVLLRQRPAGRRGDALCLARQGLQEEAGPGRPRGGHALHHLAQGGG
eukprot:scaffold2096_cov156-Isochrysis_galbana.AAC.4